MKTKVLGISSSPRKASNTTLMVDQALQGAKEVEDVETELLSLASKKITPCDGCEICFEEDRCKYNADDYMEIYLKIQKADGIILGSPTYFGTVCAQCKALMDRFMCGDMRAFAEKKKKPMSLKVGGAIAVAGGKYAGQETTLQTIVNFFMFCDMLPIGTVSPHTQLGAAGRGFDPGDVRNDTWDLSVLKGRQTSSLEACWMFGRKIATVAMIVKAGIQATGLEAPDTPYGSNMPPISYV